MTNKRDVGNAFEIKVSQAIPNGKLTPNSGAMFNNADVVNDTLVVECKVRNKPSINISKIQLEKLKKQALLYSKDYAFANKTTNGEYITISLEHFKQLLADTKHE